MKTFKLNRTYLAISIMFFVANTFSLQAKTIYYVTATGTGNGSSWSSAANNIQTMIDKAVSGDEVWVAKGTYYPTTETIARDSRSRSFVVKSGVNLYGGFTGSETDISQRALADLNADGKTDSYEFANQTILTGDIDGVADIWTKTTNTDGTLRWSITNNENNCYRVVTCLDINTIDGFYITGGNANHTTIDTGGGIYNPYYVSHCTVSNCYASSGGGIYLCTTKLSTSTTNATDCMIFNCSASSDGGGIYSFSPYGASLTSLIKNCSISSCSANNGGGIFSKTSATYSSLISSISNCNISNCSALIGGGIYSTTSTYNIYSVNRCLVSNCSASNFGGGIYSTSYIYITNCTVVNCSTNGKGGGIYSSSNISSNVKNCATFNCSAILDGGGIYSSTITNCAVSNNITGTTIGVGANYGTILNTIYPTINQTFATPTSFIGVATTDVQRAELLTADWHLREGSPCINAGTNLYYNSATYGIIDIGTYEYSVPKINLPAAENFNDITDWNSSNTFYNSAQLNGGQNIKWNITNQKAQFSWQVNLTSAYTEPFFTYQVDASNTTKVYLRYDMYFQAYAGTITPLGTEKLNIEFSTDLVAWSTIATYSNANGTIANQTYKHDISTLAAGKTFFIRFNANGSNTNRIEKWEIDNVIIDADGLSAVNTVQVDKYKYSVNNGVLNIANLEQASFVQLFDVNGKLISAKNTGNQMCNFLLPAHGVYIVKVASDSRVENKKVVW